MNLRRVFAMLIVITLCFTIITSKLMLIQLFGRNMYSQRGIDLTAAAVYQREQDIVLDDGRGRFLDRFGKPLTGFEIRVLVIEPLTVSAWSEQHQSDIHEVRQILGMREEEWEALLDRPEQIVLWERDGKPVALNDEQEEALTRLQISGISTAPYMLRFRPPFYAAHLIGYISQHPERASMLYENEILQGTIRPDSRIGASGLELTFERDMRARGSRLLSIFTDAVNRPLGGMESRIRDTNHRFFPLQAVTTLDLELQAQVEQLLDRAGVKEASVVLLDPRSADVLVMANRPNYNPLEPNPASNDWANRAIREQVPGSIFKAVIAAAALEYGVVRPQERFVCNGEYGKYGFTCWKKGGHGQITFQEAFAHSCNITFAQVAKRLTPNQIVDTAYRLGIGRTIGWEGKISAWKELSRQFDHEEAGRVFADEVNRDDEGVLIQTAIGQRDVRMTPLQAANLLVSLLNGGRLTSPRAVSALKYRDGGIRARFPTHRINQARISKDTAARLLAMMRQTVLTGTASTLRDHHWKLAGKTGTAQVGTHDGKVNQWFIGYGPTEHPQVAAAVVVYNIESTGKSMAVELFAEIMDIVRHVYEERSGS